jgi:hypothetical protein
MPTLHLRVQQPAELSRLHVLIRLFAFLAFSALTGSHGWPGGFLYLAIPVLTALLVSEHGTDGFLQRDSRPYIRVLTWLLQLYAYLGLLTDHLPGTAAANDVRIDLEPAGRPTAASALLRLLTSLPALIALSLLGILSAFVWFLAAVFVLATTHYPAWLFDFQAAVLRYHGRFLAWHASLIETYPASLSETPEAPIGPTSQPSGHASP